MRHRRTESYKKNKVKGIKSQRRKKDTEITKERQRETGRNMGRQIYT
jgi:hypothetical protein